MAPVPGVRAPRRGPAPAADVVPAYLKGRATAYEWRCAGGAPAIVRQIAEPDARGFLSDVWHEIPPPGQG